MILLADSGSTKTDWAAISDGRIYRFDTMGLNPIHLTDDAITDVMRVEVREQVKRLTEKTPSQLFFYGAGCINEHVLKIRHACLNTWSDLTDIVIESDLIGAAHATCRHRQGIVCILGTGSNSCHFGGEKIIAQTPPLGYILGDEGSGTHIAKLFLNAMLKKRIPKGITDQFYHRTGLNYESIIRSVYGQVPSNRFLASLSPHIHHFKSDENVREIIIQSFTTFIDFNLTPYEVTNLPVHAVGSMAWHYRQEWSAALSSKGYQMGDIQKSPIEGLILYHAQPTPTV